MDGSRFLICLTATMAEMPISGPMHELQQPVGVLVG